MAPISQRMQHRYSGAVQTALDLFYGQTSLEEVSLDDISELKGMFNRCVRQDQWDWFSVYSSLGQPLLKQMRLIVSGLQALRRSLQVNDRESIETTMKQLEDNDILLHLHNYKDCQTESSLHTSSDDVGWVYILSTRDAPTVLKIGMTRRPVSKRVKEINAATGVLTPFSVRRIFPVKQVREAERDIFKCLRQYRIRYDREFFEMSFSEAVRVIDEYLSEAEMRRRKSGTILWFDQIKGYGFISTREHEDVYVHGSEVPPHHLTCLKPGVSVEFDIGRRLNGTCARRIRVLRVVQPV